MDENNTRPSKADMINKKVDALNKKLDSLVLEQKETYNQTLVLSARLQKLEETVHQMDMLRNDKGAEYCDEQLYNMKQSLSWKRLSEKTGIPKETLRYRVRRYINKTSDDIII